MTEAQETHNQTHTPEVPHVPPESVGRLLGRVKWFRNNQGYGFITIVTTGVEETGRDVFVHQTNIVPLVSTYRTLLKDEYVSLDISTDDKAQALNVRGVSGGPLRCDAPRPTRNLRGNGRRSDGRNTNNTNNSSNEEPA